MRNFEIKNIKTFVLIITFIVVSIFTFVSINYKLEFPVSTTMDAATLPVIMMQTENGTLFNELHGYITEVDTSLLNDSITPLPDDKKLKVVINSYNTKINKVSYKVRKLNDKSLIEDTTVSDYLSENGSINAILNIKNLIENDTEYLLEVNIVTEKHENIRYFTKIISSNNLKLQDKLDFVMNFNNATFDDSKIDSIGPIIESKATGDNSNFGKVNIYASKTQVSWGNLNVTVEKLIIPTVKEINSEVASISLKYNMAAQGLTGAYDKYNVDEYYRIRQTTSTIYLLNYEREANQVFDSMNDLASGSRINLGITSDQNINLKSSSKGNYSYFVRQGALWCFYDKDKTFTRIFSFEAEDSDNIRELYDKHNIKIMDVDDEGNVDFIVYGYMNRGVHEGEVGVSLCSYKAVNNEVRELLYIPVGVPYDVLKENVGGIAYISESNVFYLLLDDSLYSIDLTSKEIMVEINGLTDETYAVSEDGTSIAYSLNGKVYDTDEVRVFNMALGSDNYIKAVEGDKLKVLGFVKNDCIIGSAHQSDILVEANGFVTFPMYSLKIYDSSINIIKTYETEGVFVSSASVSGMRVNITRIVKNSEGRYESTSIDQLMNREENQETTGLVLETATSESRKLELYIKLVNKVTNTDNVSMKTSKEVVFVSSQSVKLNPEFKDNERNFVYGFGKFQGSYTTLARAITVANETYGFVIDNNGKCIWRRYKNTTGSIKKTYSGAVGESQSLAQSVKILLQNSGVDVDVTAKLSQGMTALDIMNEATGNGALNLKGVTLDSILYYVSIGIPVVGKISDNSYVLVTSYDSKNISYFDVSTGQSVTLLLADANKLFTLWGNVFLAYIK